MADVPGVNDELRRIRKRIDARHGLLEGANHVFVGRLVESDMTVADLYKVQAAAVHHGVVCVLAKGYAALHSPQQAGARPLHAFEKAAPVDAVRAQELLCDCLIIHNLLSIPDAVRNYSPTLRRSVNSSVGI